MRKVKMENETFLANSSILLKFFYMKSKRGNVIKARTERVLLVETARLREEK